MSKPEPRSFAPVDRDEDLPEDVLHWARLFQDVAVEKARDGKRTPTQSERGPRC